MHTQVNGLDTERLNGLIQALKGNANAGKVAFRSNSAWQDGARVFTRFKGYKIDGTPHHEESRSFVLLNDEPVEMSGTDTAPGPVEQLLNAVGACIAATCNANAALMGVNLDKLEVELEGELDLHGIFGLDPDVRPGLSGVRATITISGDADESTLRKIAEAGYGSSPVRESVEKGVTFQRSVTVA